MEKKQDYTLWILVGVLYGILIEYAHSMVYRIAFSLDINVETLMTDTVSIIVLHLVRSVISIALICLIKELFKNRKSYYLQPILFAFGYEIVGNLLQMIYKYSISLLAPNEHIGFYFMPSPQHILIFTASCYMIWNHWNLSKKMRGTIMAIVFNVAINILAQIRYTMYPNQYVYRLPFFHLDLIFILIACILCIPYILDSKKYYPSIGYPQE